MEIHDPPDHTRYYPSAAGRIEFLSFSPATSLQRLNFRVADHPGVMAWWLESNAECGELNQVTRHGST
jgi:hypothetical protein